MGNIFRDIAGTLGEVISAAGPQLPRILFGGGGAGENDTIPGVGGVNAPVVPIRTPGFVGPGLVPEVIQDFDPPGPIPSMEALLPSVFGDGPKNGMKKDGTPRKKTRTANPMNMKANKAAVKRLKAAVCHARKLEDELNCLCAAPKGRSSTGRKKR